MLPYLKCAFEQSPEESHHFLHIFSRLSFCGRQAHHPGWSETHVAGELTAGSSWFMLPARNLAGKYWSEFVK